MIYIVNSITNQNYFIKEKTRIDKYALQIIDAIKDRGQDKFVDASFGDNNVHITAIRNNFDIWLYNKKHLKFQQALIDAEEKGYNLLVLS